MNTNIHNLTIGLHTSKDEYKGMLQPLEIDGKLLSGFKNKAVQIFTQVPQTTKIIKMEPYNEIIQFLQQNHTKLMIHTPYAMNNFWKGDLTKLIQSLENAEHFLSDIFHGLVIHLPKDLPENVANILKNRPKPNVPILLENHAYKPDIYSFELPEKLNRLTELLIDNDVQNWGYCIDTAHLFVQISKSDRAKGYTIETSKGMNKWLSELSRDTKSHIKAWHLNGSMNLASSYTDKHAIPLFGMNFMTDDYTPDCMWGDLLMRDEIKNDGLTIHLRDQVESLLDSSLFTVISYAMEHNTPVILEINRGNDDDIKACLTVIQALEQTIMQN